jgi:hypothetical protein
MPAIQEDRLFDEVLDACLTPPPVRVWNRRTRRAAWRKEANGKR